MDLEYKEKYLKYKAKYLKLKSKEKELNKKSINMKGGSNMNDNNNNKNSIYLFKADWCGHCKQFKPTWNKLKDEMSNKINFITYDSVKNAKEIKEYNISGFPTLIIKTGNKAIEYVGPKNEQSIKDFINQYN